MHRRFILCQLTNMPSSPVSSRPPAQHRSFPLLAGDNYAVGRPRSGAGVQYACMQSLALTSEQMLEQQGQQRQQQPRAQAWTVRHMLVARHVMLLWLLLLCSQLLPAQGQDPSPPPPRSPPPPPPPTPANVLTLFRNDLASDPNGILAASWTGTDPCTGPWLGVTCANNVPTILDLSYSSFSGGFHAMFCRDHGHERRIKCSACIIVPAECLICRRCT